MSSVAGHIPTCLLERATAVIIGRAGSKGLPGKNASIVAGRPIVEYSIEHAREAEAVGRLIVSTDSPAIAETAGGCSGVEVIARPTDLASDTATVDAAVRHAVEDDTADMVVILYANVPVRPIGLIDRAIVHLHESGADSVQSYAPVGKYHPYWESRIDEAGRVTPYVENTVYRRQDLPPLYVPDGGVIALKRRSLFTVIDGEPHAFLGRDRRGVINDGGTVIDIDESIDLIVAEALLTGRATSVRSKLEDSRGLARADR